MAVSRRNCTALARTGCGVTADITVAVDMGLMGLMGRMGTMGRMGRMGLMGLMGGRRPYSPYNPFNPYNPINKKILAGCTEFWYTQYLILQAKIILDE